MQAAAPQASAPVSQHLDAGALRLSQDSIAQLEAFVEAGKTSDDDPDLFPTAMFRLAAFYEHKVRRSDEPEQLASSIALYKRVVREFPNYKFRANILYHLGHALNDAYRVAEAQQVWRSLACPNHYAYPVPASTSDPKVDQVLPLPGDASAEHWIAWRKKFPTHASLKAGGVETKFINPYPDDCKPAQGAERYVSEIWWRIGEWEWNQDDVGAGVLPNEPYGVWNFNRAQTAYQLAMTNKTPPIFSSALYKSAWVLFRQERYEAAVGQVVNLLNYIDDEEAKTGDRAADFRKEATRLVAAALVTDRFAGPAGDAPFIEGDDIVGRGLTAPALAKALRVAVSRVVDPKIIPQDKPWTIQIYAALLDEFVELGLVDNAERVHEKMRARWPSDALLETTNVAISAARKQRSQATGIQRIERRKKEPGPIDVSPLRP